MTTVERKRERFDTDCAAASDIIVILDRLISWRRVRFVLVMVLLRHWKTMAQVAMAKQSQASEVDL